MVRAVEVQASQERTEAMETAGEPYHRLDDRGLTTTRRTILTMRIGRHGDDRPRPRLCGRGDGGADPRSRRGARHGRAPVSACDGGVRADVIG